MKHVVVPAAALAVFSLVTAASAATMEGTGVVKQIDKSAHTVTLNGGEVLYFQPKLDVSKLKAGEKVSYMYETKDGKMWAESFKATK